MQTFLRGLSLTVVGFALGSLPFSLWLGRHFLGTDIRAVGDHNPGATNVLRAGGRGSAAAALLLDITKGFLPVAMAYRILALPAQWLAVIALAPVLGHAFSPLLGGRGGKAVAVTGGVWMGLTLWEGPTVGGLTLLALSKAIRADGWAVLPALATMFLYLLATPRSWNPWWPRPASSVIAAVGLGNLAILAWKHRADFHRGPGRATVTGNR